MSPKERSRTKKYAVLEHVHQYLHVHKQEQGWEIGLMHITMHNMMMMMIMMMVLTFSPSQAPQA
jgi:hypothetical protein